MWNFNHFYERALEPILFSSVLVAWVWAVGTALG